MTDEEQERKPTPTRVWFVVEMLVDSTHIARESARMRLQMVSGVADVREA